MEAAKKAKSVKRLIYVGSTTAIFDGSHMHYADESILFNNYNYNYKFILF